MNGKSLVAQAVCVGSIGVLGSAGSFGRFIQELAGRFLPATPVVGYDPMNTSIGSYEEVSQCDIIFLAVPISKLEAALKKIVPKMKSTAVLVDVGTVKQHTVKLLEKHAASRRWVATHPMFGPESYQKRGGDVGNFRIVICKHTLPDPIMNTVRQFFEGVGFKVVGMTADEHDYHLARTLFLTHFNGQAVSRCDFDRTEIDTVSFGFFMDAVESVRHDRALFEDVFRYNRRHCLDAVRQYVGAQIDLMVELAGLQFDEDK